MEFTLYLLLFLSGFAIWYTRNQSKIDQANVKSRLKNGAHLKPYMPLNSSQLKVKKGPVGGAMNLTDAKAIFGVHLAVHVDWDKEHISEQIQEFSEWVAQELSDRAEYVAEKKAEIKETKALIDASTKNIKAHARNAATGEEIKDAILNALSSTSSITKSKVYEKKPAFESAYTALEEEFSENKAVEEVATLIDLLDELKVELEELKELGDSYKELKQDKKEYLFKYANEVIPALMRE